MDREQTFRLIVAGIILVTFGTRSILDIRQSQLYGGIDRRGDKALFTSTILDVCVLLAMFMGFMQIIGFSVLPLPIAGTTELVVRSIGVVIAVFAGFLTLWPRFVRLTTWGLGDQPPASIPDHFLVTTGPYAYIRHPFYTAMMLGWFGVELAFGSFAFVIVVPLCFVAMRTSALQEEIHLSESYPDAYPAYMRRTGRFVPWIGRGRAVGPAIDYRGKNAYVTVTATARRILEAYGYSFPMRDGVLGWNHRDSGTSEFDVEDDDDHSALVLDMRDIETPRGRKVFLCRCHTFRTGGQHHQHFIFSPETAPNLYPPLADTDPLVLRNCRTIDG